MLFVNKCNNCSNLGAVKKIKICGDYASELFNFNSELHLCNKCYNEFIKMFDVDAIENGTFKFKRELMIYLNNMSKEGQERVFNHYAYGPYVKYMRPQDWMRATDSVFKSGDIVKRSLPKGKRIPKIDDSICIETFWLDRNGKRELNCPFHEVFNPRICETCQYFNLGPRVRTDLFTEEQARVYSSMRRNQLELQEESKIQLRAKPQDKVQNKRAQIGSLEFGFPEK